MWKEFKEFAFKGNLLDLAVAVVLGIAFNDVVKAIVKDLVTPLVAAIAGQPDFASLTFTINKSHFLYGDVINFIINFLVIAFVLFLVVQTFQRLQRRPAAAEPGVKSCPYCLESIPLAATRCKYCTSELPAA